MPTDKQFTQFRRKQIAELRPYMHGEKIDHVSVSDEDRKAGSPKLGDMIARNPKNHADQWLVAAAYFADNFEALTAAEQAQEAQPVLKVKPLDWESVSVSYGPETYEAETLCGFYQVFSDEDSASGAVFTEFAFDQSNFGMTKAISIGRFADFEPAKAAAQADFEQRILAALETAEQAQEAQPMVIPEGWQLVPIKPTREMLRAGLNAVPYEIDEPDGAIADRIVMREEYSAMLAAAPKPGDHE